MHDNYIQYISQLPLNTAPEAFGLHSNADITIGKEQSQYQIEMLNEIYLINQESLKMVIESETEL